MKNKKLSLCARLFYTFFKIGLFTFGGGYAMIPLIERETAEKNKWVTDSDILDIVAVAEATPGPVAINAATFVGYKTAGFWGSFFATFGVVLPSFIIIYIISVFFREFADIKIVKYAFFGIRAGVIALIISAFLKLFKKLPENAFSYILAAAAFIAVAFFNVGVLAVILFGAVTGLVFAVAGRRGK